MNYFDVIIPVFGGLGLFLYGMNLMAQSLQRTAGSKLKRWIEVLTRNRFMGVIVGTVVTMVLQSSSATTVMVIGFVNARLMDLFQAVGIIMGANIGTTITGQLIAFKLDRIAPIFVLTGVILWITAGRKKLKNMAEVVVGFGILFVGMGMMGNGLEPLKDSQTFVNVLTTLNNPLLGLLAGFILTTILQSSSAALGLLQALAGQGLVSMGMAFPILFGENIGTTTTALISSIGASKTAKRAALIHLLFNVIGTIIFMSILRLPIQKLVIELTPNDTMRQIANAHTLFNVINVIILFPFGKGLVKLSEKLVTGEDKSAKKASKYLDMRFIEMPGVALDQVKKEIAHMGELVLQNLDLCNAMVKDSSVDFFDRIEETEANINKLNREITEFLVKVGHATLTDEEQGYMNLYLYCINDVERMGDYVENIAELLESKIEGSLRFSEKGLDDCITIMGKVRAVVESSIQALTDGDETMARYVRSLESEVDEMEETMRKDHMHRLNIGKCAPEQGIIFLDMISNLERISDHGDNLAKYILGKFLQ